MQSLTGTIGSPGAVALLLLVGLLAGCSQTLAQRPVPGITPEMLVAAVPLGGPVSSTAPAPDDVLRVTNEMRAFARSNVTGIGTDYDKMRALLTALRLSGRFDLIYDERTRTAAETFTDRKGNCLSFTNMFIALAREVNIPVSFQEVDVPPTWVRSGESVIVNRHINVSVTLNLFGEHVVDFNMSDFRAAYPRQRVSDARGLAHFYSNLGAERMMARDTRGAVAAFDVAIGEDPTFAAAWNNLGLLYLHAGAQDFAEAAWQHALTMNPADLSVMSNLARLYEMQGRTSEWRRLERTVDRYRLKNPYFRYWLAEQALEKGDFKESESQLRIAIRAQPEDDSFYALLALVYARQSNAGAAQHWLVKAAEVATDDSHRKAYDQKLELLRAAAAGG